MHLECQVRCYVIQDAVIINQDNGFIDQEVRRQLLIKAISRGRLNTSDKDEKGRKARLTVWPMEALRIL